VEYPAHIGRRLPLAPFHHDMEHVHHTYRKYLCMRVLVCVAVSSSICATQWCLSDRTCAPAAACQFTETETQSTNISCADGQTTTKKTKKKWWQNAQTVIVVQLNWLQQLNALTDCFRFLLRTFLNHCSTSSQITKCPPNFWGGS